MILEWEIGWMLLSGEESVCYGGLFWINELQFSIHEANMVTWASGNLTFLMSAYGLIYICLTLRERGIPFDGVSVHFGPT